MNVMTEIPSVSNTLASRALIVSLTIHQWSGRRFDRKISDEVNETHGAANDASRTTKSLVPKSALAGIQKIASAIRTEFNQRSLPWLDDGQRVIAAETYVAHAAWLNSERAKFDAAVQEFLVQYPTYVAEAETRLGAMFNTGDYPPAEEIHKKFGMEMRTQNAPDATDFRVSVSDAQAEQIRAEIEQTVNEATRRAVSDVYRRVRDVCERMVDRLNTYKPAQGKGERAEGVFKNSLVENVRDLIKVMPSLNITGDPELDKLAKQLETIARHDADVLRISTPIRQDTAAEAQKILDQMNAFVA
ncbi:MAG: hypothetical protein JJ902_05365 [Roseibium sp.]|nr:hypothetical protein [Roseibium sp.]